VGGGFIMALTFKFKSSTMDKIMYIVRGYDVTPSDAVDLLLNNKDIYKEAQYATRERGITTDKK
jgi:hypothetical protein